MRSAAQGSSGDVLQNAAKKLAPAAFEKKKNQHSCLAAIKTPSVLSNLTQNECLSKTYVAERSLLRDALTRKIAQSPQPHVFSEKSCKSGTIWRLDP